MMPKQSTSTRNTTTLIGFSCLALWVALSCAGDRAIDLGAAAPGQPLWESVSVSKVDYSPELLTRGKQLYGIRCSNCHGLEGGGQGPASLYLGTPPRDFRQGVFKFRTSASGALPTDEDLFRTVTAGFPAYGMPSFDYLPIEDRWALVHYVKTFAERFQRQERVEGLNIGVEPESAAARLEQGKKVFEKAQCGKCHGEDGRGFGPSAEGLEDGWGHPIRTLDLTSPKIYFKGGSRARDIMRTLSTGLNGAPMPSYLESGFSTEELWSLAYYIESLVGETERPE